MKTDELIGDVLDRAVAKCEGSIYHGPAWTRYSTDWSQGGIIIEREGIAIRAYDNDARKWSAEPSINTMQTRLSAFRTGPTALIAAMRCYVAYKIGDDIEIA